MASTHSDQAHSGRAVAYPMQASRIGGGNHMPGELVADTIEATRAILPAGLTWHEQTPLIAEMRLVALRNSRIG